MKKLVLACAVAALAVSCKSDDAAQVSDPSSPEAPAASCDMKSDCEMKSDCATECTGEAGAKVCPVTGKSME